MCASGIILLESFVQVYVSILMKTLNLVQANVTLGAQKNLDIAHLLAVKICREECWQIVFQGRTLTSRIKALVSTSNCDQNLIQQLVCRMRGLKWS